MRFQRGLIFALAVSVAVGACGPAATTDGTQGPSPANTRFTNQANLQLAQAQTAEGEQARQLYQQALDITLEGIESAPENPQHYYIAGIAQAGLGDFAAADTMWNRALEIFPGYEEDIEVAREQAWAQAFNEGVVAYNAGNMDEAVRQWTLANQVFEGRPEAYFNLAAIYTQQQQFDQAVDAFRQSVVALDREPGRELSPEEIEERDESRITALQNLGQLQLHTEQFADAEATFRRLSEAQPDNVAAQSSLAVALARQGRQDEAMQAYQTLLARPNLSANDIMSVGVGLFQAEQFQQAGDAFRRITEMAPNNRDAWYNYLNALYAQERFTDLIPVADRLIELDPLNENAHLILARAHREAGQNQRALQVLQRNEAHPIHVDNFQLRAEENRSVLSGVATGGQARAGAPVRLEFTFFGPDGDLGSETVTVTAPAQGETASFEVALTSPTPAVGFRYRVAS